MLTFEISVTLCLTFLVPFVSIQISLLDNIRTFVMRYTYIYFFNELMRNKINSLTHKVKNKLKKNCFWWFKRYNKLIECLFSCKHNLSQDYKFVNLSVQIDRYRFFFLCFIDKRNRIHRFPSFSLKGHYDTTERTTPLSIVFGLI